MSSFASSSLSAEDLTCSFFYAAAKKKKIFIRRDGCLCVSVNALNNKENTLITLEWLFTLTKAIAVTLFRDSWSSSLIVLSSLDASFRSIYWKTKFLVFTMWEADSLCFANEANLANDSSPRAKKERFFITFCKVHIRVNFYWQTKDKKIDKICCNLVSPQALFNRIILHVSETSCQ